MFQSSCHLRHLSTRRMVKVYFCTDNVKVATVLGSIPGSSYTALRAADNAVLNKLKIKNSSVELYSCHHLCRHMVFLYSCLLCLIIPVHISLSNCSLHAFDIYFLFLSFLPLCLSLCLHFKS